MAYELGGLPLNRVANFAPHRGLRRGFIACAALTLLATSLPPATAGASKLSDDTIAAVVGPGGHVYASVPSPLFKYPNIVAGIAQVQTYVVTHPNVTVTFASALDAAKYPEKLDAFWISQNHHDLHDGFMGPVDMAAFNRAVYDALKRGGIYIVLDHVAAKGSPADVTDTLHRIEPSTVRREVEAAGFKYEGESNILANPADPHTAGVFDSSIQGRTDQFILKFRRPRSS